MHSKMIERKKHILDANGKILGRLATEVAALLRGKGKVTFEMHVDGGDFVTVINAQEVAVTGNKMEDKIYYRHSGFPGGLKEEQLKDVMGTKPEQVIIRAVYGMLPKNRLRDGWMCRLSVYAGEEK